MLLLLDHDVGVVVVLFIKNCLDKKVISLSTFIRDVNNIKNKSHFFCFFLRTFVPCTHHSLHCPFMVSVAFHE